MVRWILFVLAAALVVPHATNAQTSSYGDRQSGEYHIEGDGINPLRSWCLSALQTDCVSFHSWHFEYSNTPGYTTVATFSAEVDVITPSGYYFEMVAPSWSAAGWTPDFGAYYNGTGWIGEEDYAMTPMLAPTTLAAPMRLIWADGECATTDGAERLAGLQRCVRVPEPSSMLLLATGGIGLAYMRRRREA